MDKYELAQFGEDIAAKYLKHNDYEILTRNYHSVFGEVDIICKKKGQLIFLEVKTRRSKKFGEALAAITESKRKKIVKTAYDFVSRRELNLPMRFDVITIEYVSKDNNYTFNYIKNAFFANSYSSRFSSK